jgi:hypothetical protein
LIQIIKKQFKNKNNIIIKIDMLLKNIFIICSVLTANVMSQTCPLKCPSCTKCDTKKGTCTLARDYVTCTKSGAAGVCFAGTCNTKISLPGLPTTNRCQTYSCPVTGVCTLITAPDGTDCTPLSATGYESICVSGTCQRVWLGVTDVIPFQNTGCIGKPDNAVCDTNHVFTDGERCIGGVCRFPDGSFYGYSPIVVAKR